MSVTWQPYWEATTAYLAGAIVMETATTRLWRCITAGTSGGTEPTWATASPWTTADGSVLWTLNTTFREDVRAGMLSTLGSFKTANPLLIRKVWTVRPESFTTGDLPALVLGNMTEAITTLNGVRQRVLNGFTVEVVDRSPENTEAAKRADLIVDAVMDYLTAAYHMASGTSIVEPIGVEDGPPIEEATNLGWVSQTIGFRASVMEGRT